MPQQFLKLPNRTLIALLLALATLFAQFAGQLHRIEHANWNGTGTLQWSQDEQESDALKSHSCLVFDAITLADLLATGIILAAALAGRQAVNQRLFRSVHIGVFTALFLSRAPPRN
ncbi:MAG: hypothetical protein K0S28_539 [Paucimonas sp.]|jgi:hypothetical protein|nr:hypothetical protein [Paucimonas sp.]